MSALGTALIVGVPVLWHLAFAGLAYYDAPAHGLSSRKWGLIVLAIPILGLFAYLFERSEYYYNPEDDPYRDGGINVHENAELRPKSGTADGDREDGSGRQESDTAADSGDPKPDEWDEQWDEELEKNVR